MTTTTKPRPAAINPEILDRTPPHSPEAERAVIGSMLLWQACCDDVAEHITPDDFYADANRKLFAHIMGMHNDGGRVDALLLVERLKKAGDFEGVGGAAYLAEIMQEVPVASHAVHYAGIVKAKSLQRQLIHGATDMLRDAYGPMCDIEQAVAQAEERIFAIRDRRATGHMHALSDVLIEAMAVIDRQTGGAAMGMSTGFRDLDTITGGLRDSELSILAARPSMGKTALAMNIADHVARKLEIPTLFVSLEMDAATLVQRMLCNLSGVDGMKIQRGTLSAAEQKDLLQSAGLLQAAPLSIDDAPRQSVAAIASCCRRMSRKARVGLVVIDYLSLLQPSDPRAPRHEQVGELTRRLKELARELSAPVLCLAQLNRQTETMRDNRPRLSHLRESGEVEQNADVVAFIHREEYYLTREEADAKGCRGAAEVLVRKNRNGPTGDVKLQWEERFSRFSSAVVQKAYSEFEQYGKEDF